MWIKDYPVTKVIDYKYSILVEPFIFYSDVLEKKVIVPPNFITDWESVPIVRGTSKTPGLIHDYLSRIDSNPVVSKKTAADVYLEAMIYRNTSFLRRRSKYYTVRVAWGYFHKLPVLAPIEDIRK